MLNSETINVTTINYDDSVVPLNLPPVPYGELASKQMNKDGRTDMFVRKEVP